MRELRVDEDANEIAIISRFDLLFQSLHDYFGDISDFRTPCRIVALNEIVDLYNWVSNNQNPNCHQGFLSLVRQQEPDLLHFKSKCRCR
jgi:hypothetical protein